MPQGTGTRSGGCLVRPHPPFPDFSPNLEEVTDSSWRVGTVPSGQRGLHHSHHNAVSSCVCHSLLYYPRPCPLWQLCSSLLAPPRGGDSKGLTPPSVPEQVQHPGLEAWSPVALATDYSLQKPHYRGSQQLSSTPSAPGDRDRHLLPS